MNARNKPVTNRPWGCSSSWGYGVGRECIDEQLNVYRLIERMPDGTPFKDGSKVKFLHGQLDGMMFKRDDPQRVRLCLLYGYLKPYGRNTCSFVMSRAARKRGYKTTDGMYTRAERRYSHFAR